MKAATNDQPGFWQRSHHLDKMTFKQLVVAYFQYPAIIAYLALSVVAVVVFAYYPATLLQTLASIGVAAMIYPLAWYLIHRYILHSNWMFKVPGMASTWKRSHYDHHQDPNHLEVLFGALHTTLPTIALASIPFGYAIGGVGGAMAALAKPAPSATSGGAPNTGEVPRAGKLRAASACTHPASGMAMPDQPAVNQSSSACASRSRVTGGRACVARAWTAATKASSGGVMAQKGLKKPRKRPKIRANLG